VKGERCIGRVSFALHDRKRLRTTDETRTGMEFDPKKHDTLFTVTRTNKHSTEKNLKEGEWVQFKGSGAVVGITYEGFGSKEEKPVRIYKISADILDLV
jgi:hypothetical protein